MEKLKRVVIKEELLLLTGDYKKAIILNQFIYWSERVQDFDKFIKEEKERCRNNNLNNNQQYQNGWLYKSCEELSDETMLGLSKSNMGVHIKYLIDKGWINERNNPIFKWDRTKQYRVNLIKIQKDLIELGFVLEGYPLPTDFKIEASSETEHAENEDKQNPGVTEHASSKTEHACDEMKHQSFDIEPRSNQNETAIPEITTETTSETILSQSVSHEEDGRTDDKTKNNFNDFKNLVGGLEITEDESNMLIQAYKDIATSKKQISNHYLEQRIKNIKLINVDVINFAIEKFKKVNKESVKNPQMYFTSILYNATFEIHAKKIIDTNVVEEKVENTIEKNIKKNKFHNFEGKLTNFTAEELKNMGKRNFERHLKSIGIDVNYINEGDNDEKSNGWKTKV